MNNNWTVKGGKVISLAPFCIMGIVNLTPDSFSDGGEFFNPEAALAHSRTLLAQGAAILDLGGESTRPGSAPVTAEEEQRRVVPLVAALQALRQNGQNAGQNTSESAGQSSQHARPSEFFISVDTWRASTAAAALAAGADIINDISGALFDPALPALLAEHQPGYILGHCPAPPATMQLAPHYENVVEELYTFFASRLEALLAAGIRPDRICLDPCPGFGKNLEHNLALLRDLRRGPHSRLLSLGLPVCVAVSRKTMLAQLLGLPAALPGPAARTEKDAATQTFTALCLESGLGLHRVHSVSHALAAARLVGALSGIALPGTIPAPEQAN